MTAGLRVKIVEEFIAIRIKRADILRDRLTRADNFFAVKLVALEFRRGLVVVANDEFDLGPGWNADLTRFEPIAFNDNLKGRIVSQRRHRQAQAQHGGNCKTLTHRPLKCECLALSLTERCATIAKLLRYRGRAMRYPHASAAMT